MFDDILNDIDISRFKPPTVKDSPIRFYWCDNETILIVHHYLTYYKSVSGHLEGITIDYNFL